MFFYANLLYTHIEWLNRVNWLLINKYAAVKNKRPKTIPNSKVIFEGKWAEKIAISLSLCLSVGGCIKNVLWKSLLFIVGVQKESAAKKWPIFLTLDAYSIYSMYDEYVCMYHMRNYAYICRCCMYVYIFSCMWCCNRQQAAVENKHASTCCTHRRKHVGRAAILE